MKQRCDKADNSNIINGLVEITIFAANTKQQTKLKNIKQIC